MFATFDVLETLVIERAVLRRAPSMCRLCWPGLAAALLLVAARAGFAANLPPRFQEFVAWSGLSFPTAVRFAPDGRVFVAEKDGLVKVFDNLSDTTPDVLADLRTEVNSYWDRGLLGLAIDPQFPVRPYIWILYTYDAPPGGTAPVWNDQCPSIPGGTTDGCVVTGRLSRLTVGPGNTLAAPEDVLISGEWCQQYPSHGMGDLQFGLDGALYVSGGEGASFTFADWGQGGGSPGSPTPRNPCGDPPNGVGGIETPPTAEGGALRAQDLGTSGDPTGLNGAILRVDPDTGAALPSNPLFGGAIGDDDRIIAYGLRNPYRFTFRPGTNELWIADVGWDEWEEIDHIADPTAAPIPNFGWPCYEGPDPQKSFAAAHLAICDALYATPGSTTPPFYAFNHDAIPDPEACGGGTSASITGIAFLDATTFPASYKGRLAFGDYSRDCIWTMGKDANGDPDPSTVTTLASAIPGPVDIQVGPDGDLYYADLVGGTIRRIQYFAGNQPPIARIQADVTGGPAPLQVHFDGTQSSDADPGDTLTYSWDLDGDGVFGDSISPTPVHTYTTDGDPTVALRVTDPHGASSTATLQVHVPNTPPVPTITTPAASLTWKVGDTISFSGHANDAQDGSLPPSAFHWQIVLFHCPSDCHTHYLSAYDGVTFGSFAAPDHDYPSYLEISLTVVDSDGMSATTTLDIQPQTVQLDVESVPPGLSVSVGSETGPTPFQRTAIVGSSQSLTAASTQNLNGTDYDFVRWSDGGPGSHNVVAPATNASLTASYGIEIFADGFETGDASRWTLTVP